MAETTETKPAEKKENPFLSARKAQLEEQKKQKAAMDKLRDDALNKEFVNDSGDNAKVVGFEESKELHGVWKPAYLVNFGNPNASHYIHCEEFNNNFKLKG